MSKNGMLLVDMHLETRILFSLGWLSGGLESDCGEESVEIVGDSLIEAVQLTAFVGGEVTIAGKGLEETGGGEGGAGGDVGIADQSMHHRQLPRVIERKARDALSVGQGGGLS
jgi:hypothetical protein